MPSLSALPPALLLLPLSLFPRAALSSSQNSTISGLSLCYNQCLDSNASPPCDSVSCICSPANPAFLTSAIDCVQSNCPSELTSNFPLNNLDSVCSANGTPIPSSALAAAENAASSAALASESTYMTAGDGEVIGTASVTATDDAAAATTITVDSASGSASGGLSTAQTTSGGTAATLSSSSSSSLLLAGGGAETATSVAGSTAALATLVSESGTTYPAAVSTAIPLGSSAVSSHSNSGGADAAVKTEGAPLGMQGTGTRRNAGSLLSLTVWLIAGIVWF
ncbi:MAG: hypothetical protein FRX48_05119 [Lasallia pustulata]|uniref:CFEM domain-containing protein n=1 Tax=Lasallia pustulata TaxID=136370 RepID=A0A5M8PMQ4_9LECA|nr:MAG: hypothetical protein FRX48_05119 [Lasallia pustulata]